MIKGEGTMKTKNILKALAFALLLTTACNKVEEVVINNEDGIEENAGDKTEQKGFELPVTVNVTRQGDDPATKATYNESTKKLEFSTGDKLFVWSHGQGAGWFAGTLDYVSGGTFTGTIYTKEKYTGTAEELFSTFSNTEATLLPAGYEDTGFFSITGTGCDTIFDVDIAKAFATSTAGKTAKAIAIEQFSAEGASGYSNGFALQPQTAILNFTITGLTANTNFNATLTAAIQTNPASECVSGSVTTDDSGNALFAMALYRGIDYNNLTLTIGGTDITIVSGTKQFTAGKVYNVKRTAGALPGKFTISNDGGTTTSQVFFSKGNLQATYNGSEWSWAFAANQWDYIGKAASNKSITGNGTVSANGTVDLFGWVGNSSSWTGAAQYGISNSYDTGAENGYGTGATENLKSDWGNTVGSGWRTLTGAEWAYLFNTRASGSTVNDTSNARYTHATINTDGTGVNGMILFPDGVTIATSEATSWGTVNGNSDWGTKCTSSQWTALAAKGCVFLPAAGYRYGASVYKAGSNGGYWSSSPYASNVGYAYRVDFSSGGLSPQSMSSRCYGRSVRLVRAVE